MTDDLISVVGYGTFITRELWKEMKNVEPCLVKNHARIFPKGNWFPYVLPKEGASFWALKFDANEPQLKQLDYYEGVEAGLYERVLIPIIVKSGESKRAYIYIPTRQTIERQGLSPSMDPEDRWKEEIKKKPEIVAKFPELIS